MSAKGVVLETVGAEPGKKEPLPDGTPFYVRSEQQWLDLFEPSFEVETKPVDDALFKDLEKTPDSQCFFLLMPKDIGPRKRGK